MDVFNPFVWASWHGDEEHLEPDPAAGYHHELRERTTFDPVTCTATDTWWDTADPGRVLSQHLRCYTPADLALLLTGTGLALSGVAGRSRSGPAARSRGARQRAPRVFAVLRHDPAPTVS